MPEETETLTEKMNRAVERARRICKPVPAKVSYANLLEYLEKEQSFENARAVCHLTRSLVLDSMGLEFDWDEQKELPDKKTLLDTLNRSLDFVTNVQESTKEGTKEHKHTTSFRKNLEVRIGSLEIVMSGKSREEISKELSEHLGEEPRLVPLFG